VTYEPSQQNTSMDGSDQTLSAEGSRARTCQQRIQMGRGWTVKEADFGLSTTDSFASYDHGSSSWKTSQTCLSGELAEFSGPWPSAGLLRDGRVYALPSSEPPTQDEESGLLPTPTASDFRGGRTPEAGAAAGRSERNNLRDYCRQVFGWTYPKPEFAEWMMGFPRGWTDLRECKQCGRVLLRKRFTTGRLEDWGVFQQRQFCGKECQRIAQIKPDSTAKQTMMSRARKFKKNYCERCGVSTRLHIHHRDKDITNNAPKNLMTLCVKCHNQLHAGKWSESTHSEIPSSLKSQPGLDSES
jgi:hypothetical protein